MSPVAQWGSSEEAPEVFFFGASPSQSFFRIAKRRTKTEAVLTKIQNRLLTPILALPQNNWRRKFNPILA
jgi:hypothetical protein